MANKGRAHLSSVARDPLNFGKRQKPGKFDCITSVSVLEGGKKSNSFAQEAKYISIFLSEQIQIFLSSQLAASIWI